MACAQLHAAESHTQRWHHVIHTHAKTTHADTHKHTVEISILPLRKQKEEKLPNIGGGKVESTKVNYFYKFHFSFL